MEPLLRHSTLFLINVVGIICVNVFMVSANMQQRHLSAYELTSFNNPDQEDVPRAQTFNHFTLSDHGDVYVGAVNWLYRLNSRLEQIQNASTCDDSMPYNGMPCRRTNNYNKILVVDSTRPNGLITCGGVFDGICQLRQLQDIRFVMSESDHDVAGFEGETTVGLIAPGRGEHEMLYVAATYSVERVDTTGRFSSIVRRNLSSNPILKARKEVQDAIFFNDAAQSESFFITYVASFSHNGFTYFVANQKEDLNSAHYVSKMNRVCQTGPNLDAYTEITIQCNESDGSAYSLVQAAHFGPAGPDLAASLDLLADEQVLYAVFAKNQGAPGTSDVPTDHSALCVYRMTDILAGFQEAVRGCIQDGTAYSVGYLDGSFCRMFSGVQPDNYLCNPVADGMTQLYKYAKGITPVSSTALLEQPGTLMSSVITSIEVNQTLAFIGTSSGNLLKVHVEDKTTARLYERVPLDTSPVLTDVKINGTSREMHVLTEQKLIKMRAENCGQYTNCEACIGTDAGNDGDPYCGWCTLERKCSRYSDCDSPDVPTRWLAYNAAQCINITDVAPYDSLSITVTEQQIKLTVQQLPDLKTDESYACYFGSYQTPATKNGDVLNCTSPPSSQIPRLPQGDDSVRVDVGVWSSETSVRFIDTDFNFYNCSTHTTCVSCVGSRWACDWCVFDNRCTHESSTCTKANEIIITGENNPASSPMQGPGFCPQLLNQTSEVLLPNDVRRSITVTTKNLPAETGINFQCSLDVDGSPETVGAVRNGNNITCNEKAYTYSSDNEPEFAVRLTVTWTDMNGLPHILDDIYEFHVTLYKCEVQKPDCSRCVTARPELGCLWCGAVPTVSGVCKLNESCTENIVTLYNGVNCPDPVLSEVFPLTGPIQGNTILAVMGTDIGRRFGDVRAVMVGNQRCDLDGLDSDYVIGSSVSCKTRPETEGSELVTLTITGADGSQQDSSGTVNFRFTDPKITSFEPRFGPEAGGTVVSVDGSALNTGRKIEAFIGNFPCNITGERFEPQLHCVTSSAGQVGFGAPLNVSFDGTPRISSSTYTYVENPVITRVSPLKSIISGGRLLTVRGTALDTCVNRQIVVFDGSGNQEVEKCSGESDIMMQCPSPNITRFTRAAANENVTFGFIMDGVTELMRWSLDNGMNLEYFQDPVYYEFEDGIRRKEGSTLNIMGEGIDSAVTANEIIVRIGTETCDVSVIAESILQCSLPDNPPSPGDFLGNDTQRGLPVVWVIHSNLRVRIGYIEYPPNDPTIPIVASVSGAILLCILIAVFCFVAQVYGAKREAKLILQDMRDLEESLAGEVRQAFVELQTDMTDLTRDLEVAGMPFVSHRDYATNMLFTGQAILPSTEDEEHPNEQVERAMHKFSQLLSNKNFLLLLIQTLDEERGSKLSIREKQSIASLLTVVMILENKLVYMTDVMITLMTRMIEDAADSNRTRQLFCRTESILEKLMSNWVALCLYDQLKLHTAYPLFVLYRAIKYRSENGPIDVITGRSRFSLNYEKLLQEDVKFNPVTLVVLMDERGKTTREVKVLDVDTISQVKEKILDAIHGNKPYSSRPSANQVSLEWRQGRGGKLVLTDMDVRPLTDKWRRINMLQDFHVRDSAHVVLVEKQDVPNAKLSGALQVQGTSNINFNFDDDEIQHRKSTKQPYSVAEVEQQEGIIDWHLTQEEEWPTDEEGGKRRKQGGCISLDVVTSRNKITRRKIKEISFPRLLSTKGIVQAYVNNMFKAILSVESAPKAIKYLFDFFDSQAYRHDLLEKDPDIVHVWKSNILPLRFWANAIKHPDYIFDIHASRTVEASLDVIAQLFHDSHDTKTQKLGRETSINKLLYGRERTRYHDDIVSFYEEVEELPSVPTQELNKELYKACEVKCHCQTGSTFSHQ
ncbi:plexin-B-like [Acanthaster planci]|uniref:Plexin-B-like n=1 Tax=Acanthaster planci TaxID=133434 RepID=A0A8B7ZKI2_ACAPL|nr:plexin-B-like [Acanthaster planci]